MGGLSRIFPAWLLAVGLLLVGWAVAFLLLPERAVAAVWLAGRLPLPFDPADGEERIALAIFVWNLVFGGGTILLASLFRIGRLPAAYLAPWTWFLAYGLLLGTNSFAFASPSGKSGPDLTVVFGQVGFAEMSAYFLLAAALADRSLWHYRSWRHTRLTRVREWSELRLSARDATLGAAGIALLAFSALVEAGGLAHLSG